MDTEAERVRILHENQEKEMIPSDSIETILQKIIKWRKEILERKLYEHH
jgi:hypothetical protein